MNEPLIRLSRPTDINTLVALDIKTYNYPLSIENWQALVNGSGRSREPRVVVMELARKPVGFAMWQHINDQIVKFLRLGILPHYRRKGLARILIDSCVQDARRQKANKIQISVPELHCIPDDPDNVVGFLNKVGFNPTGEVINNYGIMYGESVDAYVFERSVF